MDDVAGKAILCANQTGGGTDVIVTALRSPSGASLNVIDAIFGVIEPVEVHYQPQLWDAGDELVLEAAVNGRAEAIVTSNRKHYGDAPARFEALRRIRA